MKNPIPHLTTRTIDASMYDRRGCESSRDRSCSRLESRSFSGPSTLMKYLISLVVASFIPHRRKMGSGSSNNIPHDLGGRHDGAGAHGASRAGRW